MNKVITNHMGTCEHCGYAEQIRTEDSMNHEFDVCYHCGKITLRQRFDAKECLIECIRDGILDTKSLTDVLIDSMSDIYGSLELVDLETLAKLLVMDLYDEAKFTVQAEQQEADETYREIEKNYRQMVLGAM